MEHIFNYSDFREYLKDFFDMKKKQNSAFSYRYFAQKAGINSASFYGQVTKRKRNLTKKTILKTIDLLKLRGDEAVFFENLVFFNQVNSTDEKDHFFKEMVEIRKANKVKKVSDEEFEYFSHWYHAVVRELVIMMPQPLDIKKLAETVRPKITEEEAKESINLLLRLGFLILNDDGYYIQADPILSTASKSELQKLQLIKFQLETLALIRNIYNDFDESDRLASSTVFAVSEKSFKHSVDILRSNRKRLLALAEQDPDADMVYLLSTSLFPVSRKVFKDINK